MKRSLTGRLCTSRVLAGLLGAALAGAGLAGSLGPAAAVATAQPAGHSAPASRAKPPGPADWPAYLGGPQHISYRPDQTAITPGNAAKLVLKWHRTVGGAYMASPTVAGGAVFIGGGNGWLYKLSVRTGKVLDKIFTGVQPALNSNCTPLGTVATATVAVDPRSHQLTVYIAGADGYLYALRASNLTVRWKSVIAIPSATVNDYFDYSSPTVANGKIYIGVSSNCDTPLVRAGLIGYNQATGAKFGEYYTVPRHRVGGSIWSSAAVGTNGDVFVTTGNGPESDQLLGHSESILKLSPSLKLRGKFQIPISQVNFDADFGASPVLFGNYIGACDKNGIFYMLRQSTMKIAWEKKISGPEGQVSGCIAAAVYNGRYLYVAGLAFKTGGVSHKGSVQERNPYTGKLLWATGLPNGVIGSPSLDGRGVLAVGTYDFTSTPNATYLVDAANGKILKNLVRGADFAQSVFADGLLFTANDSGVYAFRPRA